MARGDPAREVQGRPGRSIGLVPAMPLDQVRIEALDRAEQVRGDLHEPREEVDAEAEVGGDHRGRPVRPERGVHLVPCRAPAGGGDDEPADASLQRDGDVAGDRLATRGIDHQVGRGERRRVVAGEGRPAEDGRALAALARGGSDGPAEMAVAEDDRLHVVVLTSLVGPRQVRTPDTKQPRSPWWCRGRCRWSLRSREAPVRLVDAPIRAPGPVPPGRTARASSSSPSRRFGSASLRDYTHNAPSLCKYVRVVGASRSTRSSTAACASADVHATGRWPYHGPPMPAPSRRHARPVGDRARPTHPLANLPRPLSERELGRRRVTPLRLALSAGAFAVIVGAAMTVASIGGSPIDPVGDVAGAVGPRDLALVRSRRSSDRDRSRRARPRPPLPTPTPEPTAPSPDSLTGYVSPLPRGRLTLPFGPTPWGSRIVGGQPFHDGMDLATFCGDRVVAAHAGKVLAAGRKYDQHIGWVGDLQPYLDRLDAKSLWSTLPIVVVIDDGNGYRSIYAHFREAVVKRGDVVKAGQLIGYEGQTGRASGCHLHYGLFSPLETATFEIDPDVVKRMKVPRARDRAHRPPARPADARPEAQADAVGLAVTERPVLTAPVRTAPDPAVLADAPEVHREEDRGDQRQDHDVQDVEAEGICPRSIPRRASGDVGVSGAGSDGR